jgi:hypothetical protein
MFNPLLPNNFIKDIPPVSDSNKKILQETTIELENPGAILADWQTMLDLISKDGIEVSKKQGYFSARILAEINQLLTHPILIDLKRPIQKSYPYIHGLYLLLRFSGITRIVHQGSKTKLVSSPEILQQWQQLNPTEKYFILLEIWMFRASEDALQGYYHTPNLLSLHRNWQLIPDSSVKITAKNAGVYNLDYKNELVNLAMLNLFGILALQDGKPLQGKGWHITYISKTVWGEALIDTLIRCLINDNSLSQPFLIGDITYGNLKPHFQAYFPDFQEKLIIKSSPSKEGIYIFKVSLGRAWRRISIPSQLILDNLAETILDAFDFCNDHLYQFICEDRLGTPMYLNHYYLEEPPFTNEFKVGQLPLEVGGKMIFHFDFGDDWEFNMILEGINSPDPQQQEAKVIGKGGTPPSQYYCDGDEDW